jgi:hypothetical protein
MSNLLDNGGVLPSGLLGHDTMSAMEGFNKSYKNYAMRVGVIVASYPVNDPKNRSNLAPEYDVIVVEQQEDKSATTILYRNCLSAEGLGSIADFFEKTLRTKKKKTRKGEAESLKGQDGAIVLILCMDGVSEKGIIVGQLTHPDRKTTLKDDGPRLEGEYNGVNIKVETDGSTTLTFKGPTDNSGKAIDDKMTPTTIKIEKDGSYQVDHKTIKHRLDKNGKASLSADDDISNTTKKNFNVTATENVAITATKNFNLQCADLIAKASGSAGLECQKLAINAQSEIKVKGSQFQVEAESMAQIKASNITLDGNVALGGAGGQPVVLLSAMIMGTGNLGIPVISSVISGFANKVTAS